VRISIPVTVAVEGSTDTPVVRKLLAHLGLDMGAVHEKNGKLGLDQRLLGYNNAAEYAPWLVLRDLNHDAPCPSALIMRLLPQCASQMCFRIAVREMEAWLLADREKLAQYLSIPISRVPLNPENIESPKLALINLARRSRRRSVRDDFVPAPGITASVGPGYLARVTEHAMRYWRSDVAAESCRSLARCLRALRRWTE
jgi:hypothetical protein